MRLLLAKSLSDEQFIKKIYSIFKIAKLNRVGIIVFPESVPRCLNSELEHKLYDMVNSTGISMVISKRSRKLSAILISPSGKCLFDKISHYGSDKKKFLSGNCIRIVKWKNYCFSVLVCYDSFFPEYASILKKQNLDFAIVQAFVPRGREEFWRSLIMIRSAELQIPVVGVAGAENKDSDVNFIAHPDFKLGQPIKIDKNYLIVDVPKFKLPKTSPLLRGRVLFKKGLFGPFPEDVRRKISIKTINLNRRIPNKKI